MKLPSERPSLLAAALLAAALGACLATPGQAQPPSCSWGSSGVVLAGAELRTLRLVGDGGAGVVAISVPTTGDDPGFPMHSSLRLHHVLEQGWLDPNLPPGGATFFRTGTGSDPDPYPRSEIVQVAADGAGGAYVLVKLCNPNQPHLRCYEVATMRLLHAGADGAMYPGWPTAGITVPGSYSYLNSGVALGIVGDAQGGVILARLDVVPGATSNSLLVQRYGPGGTTS